MWEIDGPSLPHGPLVDKFPPVRIHAKRLNEGLAVALFCGFRSLPAPSEEQQQ